MAANVILTLCAQALLVQSALSQIFGGCGCDGFVPAASTGGSFVVASASPIAPTGVSVVSENLYEGTLLIEGNLPLLGSVALEGALGTAGAGAVSYGCGNGVDIVVEEGPIITGIADEAVTGYLGGYSYGNGLDGNGLGYIGYGNGMYGNGPFGYGLGFGNGLYGNGLFGGYGLGYGNGIFGNGIFGGYGYGNGLLGLGAIGLGDGLDAIF